MLKYFFLCLFIYPAALIAQEYNVAAIPDSLKNGANVVLRYDEKKILIKGVERFIVKHKYAITVLNEDGDAYATYQELYGRLSSLTSAEGRLFDGTGKLIKSIKKKDMLDRSAADGDLATDYRLKLFSFSHKQYPYTVEYEDESDWNGTFLFPDWQPVVSASYAVQQSRFIVETPIDYELRYKEFNLKQTVIISKTDKTKIYTWETKNFAPITYEPFQPLNTLPEVSICPLNFQLQDYKGDMSSWQSLGKFFAHLYDGRDILPDNVKQEVHTIADNLPDKKTKVKALYEYLQKNTRYISIQLGIGGWQPFDAKFVGTKKYGDCKALSNYMKSLLKEVGIKANCVIIKSGDEFVGDGLEEDFPSPFFNHVIACVPDGKDTLWLECTSQTVSAGYMGKGTYGRKALLLDNDGGHVVSTPNYTSIDNRQLRKIDAAIDVEGNLSATIFTKFSGIKQELPHTLINGVSKEEREKYLNISLRLPTYKINKSNYTEIKKEIPEVDETLELNAPNYASVSGKRIFVEPNLFNKIGSKLTDDKPRKYEIRIQDAYLDVDTAIIKVPSGYKVEAAPKDVSIESKFGKYSISFKFNDNSITVIRVHEEKQAIFPPTDYPDFMKYHNDMYKADRSRMVLVKND